MMSPESEVELLAIALWWLPSYTRSSFYDMSELVQEEYKRRAEKLLVKYGRIVQ